jgi:transcription antitermination factor NusB
VIRPRSQAREAALKALYQIDVRPDLTADELDEVLKGEARSEEALAFARELVQGTRAHLAEIDVEVEAVAHNWNLKRMAVVDRNVIRIGAYELMHRDDIPPAVAINEAVVMAKKYSTKDSGSFVNGILDKIHQRRRPESVRAGRGSGGRGPARPAPGGAEPGAGGDEGQG